MNSRIRRTRHAIADAVNPGRGYIRRTRHAIAGLKPWDLSLALTKDLAYWRIDLTLALALALKRGSTEVAYSLRSLALTRRSLKQQAGKHCSARCCP